MGVVRCVDAFKGGYTVTPITRSNKTVYENTGSEITDVRLTRNLLDYTYFYNNYLVTVNGYYHRVDTDFINGLFVIDGSKSMRTANKNQIGITSFKELGGIKTISFTDTTTKFNKVGIIKFKINEDITNKTVLISFGGILLNQDLSSFTQIGDDIFKIDLTKLPFLNMYYEMKKYLNVSDMPIEHSNTNDSLLNIEQLLSEGNLNYITKMSQSFIIIVNSPAVTFEKEYVRNTNLPGQYISYKKPEYPLVLGYGRHAEYWTTYEDTQWSITVNGDLEDRLIYDTVEHTLTGNVVDTISEDKKEKSKGYLIKISN